MKRNLARIMSVACFVLLLAACGQKGPLYLPGDPSEIQTEIPPEPAGPVPAEGIDETADEADDEDQ